MRNALRGCPRVVLFVEVSRGKSSKKFQQNIGQRNILLPHRCGSAISTTLLAGEKSRKI